MRLMSMLLNRVGGWAVVSVITVSGCDASPSSEPLVSDSPTTVEDAGKDLPVGASAPFSVYAHCGFEFANIDGALWRTRLRDDGHGNPPDGWPVSVDGNIERVSENRAVFAGTNVSVRAVFRPAPHAQYLCD